MQVVLDEHLKREFKSACVLDGTNMSEVVAALISTWLQERGKASKEK